VIETTRAAAAALILAGFLGASAATSCSTPQAPAKEAGKCTLQVVSAGIISSPHINPTEAGEPRPVQVRIYQLKADIRFQNASFEEIWKKDKDTLQDDLVKVDELSVFPNTRTQVKFERDEAAQFMVVAGLFRSPKGKSWFTSFEYPPSPAKGECGAPACTTGECDAAAGPVSNPQFFIWIDDTRVEDGIEHAGDFPEGGVTTVPLSGSPSSTSAAAAAAKAAAAKATPAAPTAPAGPTAPAAPAGPSAPSAPELPKGLP
jgi:type VI secretion system protein VasD